MGPLPGDSPAPAHPAHPAHPSRPPPTAAGPHARETRAQATADQAVSDLAATVALSVDVLRAADPGRWRELAGSLRWTCWETVEHLADDLFAYAAQLAGRTPASGREVALRWARLRPAGPSNVIFADPHHGPAGLLEVLESCAGLLVSVVSTTAPDARAHHVHGLSDPAGFAAMGTVEALVHTYDVALGLEVDWSPPEPIVTRVLARLFRDVPAGDTAWDRLLWATGRGTLPGRARLERWRWYAAP